MLISFNSLCSKSIKNGCATAYVFGDIKFYLQKLLVGKPLSDESSRLAKLSDWIYFC